MKTWFIVQHADKNTKARAGTILTDHGAIDTPIFMPVGTEGTVKGLTQDHLMNSVDAQIILGNTYHLYLRPGTSTLLAAGGLHQFINWSKPMLTDSGGFQIFSLSDIRKITADGVIFKSHLDGSKHLFSPEKNVTVQREIGADLFMALDECTPYPCDKKYARKSLKITHDWLDRCWQAYRQSSPIYAYDQLLIPIIQGSVYDDLRIESTQEALSYKTPIVAIGGLSVGEPEDLLYGITRRVCEHIPVQTGRYLMGVGTPANLLHCIEAGIDMFDCVLPTRNARHGLIYTSEGIIHIKNAKWKNDFSPIDAQSEAGESQKHTKAYLHHLVRSGEMLGATLASIQNLSFFLQLMKQARVEILNDNFSWWKNSILPIISRKL